MNKSYEKIKSNVFFCISKQIQSILKTNINTLIKVKIDLCEIDSNSKKKLLQNLGSHFHTRFTYSFKDKEIKEISSYIINMESGIYKNYSFSNVMSAESDLQVITQDNEICIYKHKKTLNSLENINNLKYHSYIKSLLKDDVILFQDNNFRIIKVYKNSQ